MNDATRLYHLDDAQHATVLAALRFYQQEGLRDRATRWPLIDAIATNSGQVKALRSTQIDDLCNAINHAGLSFGEIVNQLGDDDSDPYVAAAQQHRLLEEGTLEVDGWAVVSRGDDDGAYVVAWLWVSNKAAGIAGDEEEEEEEEEEENQICSECGAKVNEIIGCPDGAEICRACFDAGKH